MSKVVVPASGAAIEVVAALSTQFILQNTSGRSIVLENAADPIDGIIVKGGETFQSEVAWTAAWTAKSPSLVDVTVRVAQE